MFSHLSPQMTNIKKTSCKIKYTNNIIGEMKVEIISFEPINTKSTNSHINYCF